MRTQESVYTPEFFSASIKEAVASAEAIIPIILEIVNPTSVIDIGCGTGSWLYVWKKHGINDVTGVDGHYIKSSDLLIGEESFIPFDLSKSFTTDRKYDLATSLEVAEHIEERSADIFIESLCRLSDIILFSAAIPGQGGTDHINEQYPNYWTEKFARQGYITVDCLRAAVWENRNIGWWYRQNIFIYVKSSSISLYEKLALHTEPKILCYVHPELFEEKLRKIAFHERLIKSPFRVASYYFSRLKGWLKHHLFRR